MSCKLALTFDLYSILKFLNTVFHPKSIPKTFEHIEKKNHVKVSPNIRCIFLYWWICIGVLQNINLDVGYILFHYRVNKCDSSNLNEKLKSSNFKKYKLGVDQASNWIKDLSCTYHKYFWFAHKTCKIQIYMISCSITLTWYIKFIMICSIRLDS